MSPQALRASGIVALGLLVAGPAASQEASQSTYEAACESLSGNARSDETVCVGVRISDGMNDISAGLAATNKFDFDGSLWRLSDDVRLSFNSTEILADDALFEFEQDELVRAELNGSPVVMSDYIEEGDKTVSGMAGSVSYDNRSGTLRLVGQVTLTVGENEFMGCDWIYNFNDKSYRAGTTDDCDGVTIVLSPPEAKDDPQVQPETL
jgi:lipopolysaccharide transport protein LptA